MDEFELIARYFLLKPGRKDVELAGGDDAAVVRLAPNERLVVTTDTLNEGTHFPRECAPDRLAARCLRTNLSDLAAMGAEPRWFTLGLSLPQAEPDWLESFSHGLAAESRRWNIDLVGGDTTRGPLSISVQMMGAVTGRWLTRAGARPDDLVMVTGTLGDAAGFLQLDDEGDSAYLTQRYWYPEPRVDFAQRARDLVSAACDISDGLVADLGHICHASGLGADISTQMLPISDELLAQFPEQALDLALSGGDDYELCLTLSPDRAAAVERLARDCKVRLTTIGKMRPGKGVECLDSDLASHPVQQRGYLHF